MASASSKINVEQCFIHSAMGQPAFLSSIWSINLPGVPTKMSTPFQRAFLSSYLEVPPTTVQTFNWWKVTSFSASLPICWANSLVGEIMQHEIPRFHFPWPAFFYSTSLSRFSIAGMTNANVLPVPVFAWAITSPPLRSTGSVWA